MARAPLALLVIAVVVLSACDASCAGAGGASPRPSATLVYTGPTENCADAFNPVECEGMHQFSVVDVRRDGERVGALLLLEGAQQIVLVLSDDGGRTFRQVGVGGSLIYQYAWDKHAINLLLHKGRVWVLLGTADQVGSQNSSGQAMFAEWDLQTGKLGPLGVGSEGGAYMVPGPAEVSADGTVGIVERWFDPGPGSNNALLWRWNLSTFDLGQRHTICTHPACFNTFWQARDDARDWQAFGVLPDNPGGWNSGQGAVCRFLNRWRGDPTLNPYGEYNCVPYSGWSGGDATGSDRFVQVFGADGLLYAVYTRGGRSAAQTISPGTVLEPPALSTPLDLGPGARFTAEGFNGRSKWRDLVLVGRANPAGAATTLVRLAEGGPVEVNLPPWPCDVRCANSDPFYETAYGAVVWLEPLGGGEWLAFWIIDGAGEKTHEERLYVERVRETTSPVRLDGPDAGPIPGVSPIPAYPGAAPATGVLEACALVQACGLGDLNQCLVRYATNTYVGHGSRDRARQALLSAATGGCPSLQAFLPTGSCATSTCEANGWTCSQTQGCVGDITIDPSFCDGRAVDFYCDGTRRVACDSAGGETVLGDCAGLDEICAADTQTGCALPGCSQTPSCDGELYSSCQMHSHCGDFAQACAPEFGCVEKPDIPLDARCHWGTDQPFCAGDFWVFCMGNRLHYLDCVDAGFSTCTPFATGVGPARCTP